MHEIISRSFHLIILKGVPPVLLQASPPLFKRPHGELLLEGTENPNCNSSLQSRHHWFSPFGSARVFGTIGSAHACIALGRVHFFHTGWSFKGAILPLHIPKLHQTTLESFWVFRIFPGDFSEINLRTVCSDLHQGSLTHWCRHKIAFQKQRMLL